MKFVSALIAFLLTGNLFAVPSGETKKLESRLVLSAQATANLMERGYRPTDSHEYQRFADGTFILWTKFVSSDGVAVWVSCGRQGNPKNIGS